jgi:hypothetical protein
MVKEVEPSEIEVENPQKNVYQTIAGTDFSALDRARPTLGKKSFEIVEQFGSIQPQYK